MASLKFCHNNHDPTDTPVASAPSRTASPTSPSPAIPWIPWNQGTVSLGAVAGGASAGCLKEWGAGQRYDGSFSDCRAGTTHVCASAKMEGGPAAKGSLPDHLSLAGPARIYLSSRHLDGAGGLRHHFDQIPRNSGREPRRFRIVANHARPIGRRDGADVALESQVTNPITKLHVFQLELLSISNTVKLT